MMAVSEIPAVGVWAYNTLKNEGITLPIYPTYQPEGQPGRAIVYRVEPRDDLNRSGQRLVAKLDLTVWVQDAVASVYPLREDARMIDEALHGRENEPAGLDGLLIVSCIRRSGYTGQVVYKGVDYRQLGGTYRVLVGQ